MNWKMGKDLAWEVIGSDDLKEQFINEQSRC
jgi:hypothetical protein